MTSGRPVRRASDETPGAAATIGEVLRRTTRRLARAGVADARVNAERLLAHLLGTDRGGLLVRRGQSLTAEQARRLGGWVARRAAREPLQHILGTQEFYGLEFEVGPAVLIPRPETEGLIDRLLRETGVRHVVDLGTGSGCIPIVLATRRVDWRLAAVERSAAALALARRNARRHGVEARIEWVHGDFRELTASWNERFDFVVSNPPYVTEEAWRGLEPEVRDHDPREALVAGADGLEGYRALLPAATAALRRGGCLLLELGQGQGPAVRGLVQAAGLEHVEILPDLAGIPRVLVARKTGAGPRP